LCFSIRYPILQGAMQGAMQGGGGVELVALLSSTARSFIPVRWSDTSNLKEGHNAPRTARHDRLDVCGRR
jgi:hypothetical protein